MSSLIYEGIQLEIPQLDGICIQFQHDEVIVQCTNYTGTFTLAKKDQQKQERPKTPSKSNSEIKRQAKALQSTGSNKKLKVQSTPSPELIKSTPTPDIMKQLFEKEDAEKENRCKQTPPASKKPSSSKKSAKEKPRINTESLVKPRRSSRTPKARATRARSKERTPSCSTKQATQANAPHATITTLEVSGVQPEGRWGHTATYLAPSNRMVVYGGEANDESSIGDLFIYDIEKKQWTSPINCGSVPRAWHSSVYLESKNLLLVFGGERSSKSSKEMLSDIMVLDTDVFLWYPPGVSGNPPSSRSGHSSNLVGDDIIVFGGSRGRFWENSVYLLNTEKWNWSKVDVAGDQPQARVFHSATTMRDQLVIIGGNDGKRCFDSVHVLQRKDDGTWEWFHPCIVGQGPCLRTGHSAAALDDKSILVYGGWDPQSFSKLGRNSSQHFCDMFLLDTVNWEWQEVFVGSEADAESLQRVGHSAVVLRADESSDAIKVLVFGGQDAKEERHSRLDEITLKRTRPNTSD